MQRCNNCSTINEVGVEKCVHCNMIGNFTPMVGGKVEPVAVKEAAVICKNCGSGTPGSNTKCAVCHFPLPIQSSGEMNSDFQNLKVS